MKCYKHSHRDAVGICKWCCKGLCHECAPQLQDDAIFCKGTCGERVKLFHQAYHRQFKFSGYFLVYLGGFMIFSGVMRYLSSGDLRYSIIYLAFGLLMSLIGIYFLKRKKTFR